MEALLLIGILVYVFVIGFWAVRRLDRFLGSDPPEKGPRTAAQTPPHAGPPAARIHSLRP